MEHTMIQRITTRQQLKDLATQLGVRDDWHEPDNHDSVTRACEITVSKNRPGIPCR